MGVHEVPPLPPCVHLCLGATKGSICTAKGANLPNDEKDWASTPKAQDAKVSMLNFPNTSLSSNSFLEMDWFLISSVKCLQVSRMKTIMAFIFPEVNIGEKVVLTSFHSSPFKLSSWRDHACKKVLTNGSCHSQWEGVKSSINFYFDEVPTKLIILHSNILKTSRLAWSGFN